MLVSDQRDGQTAGSYSLCF